jgi:hypothetical protein
MEDTMQIGKRILAVGIAVAVVAVAAVSTPSAASASTPSASTPSAVAVAASASAYEWDTAVAAGSPPSFSSSDCVSMTGVKACFEKHGDKWWVEDTKSDGHSATASWYNLLGVDIVTYRSGSCVNKLGTGKWGVCNKDYYEMTTPNPIDSRGGSYLDWEACIYDSAAGTWHGCSGDALVDNDE